MMEAPDSGPELLVARVLQGAGFDCNDLSLSVAMRRRIGLQSALKLIELKEEAAKMSNTETNKHQQDISLLENAKNQ
jgi:hypothetical protein